MYIADSGNNRIRKVTVATATISIPRYALTLLLIIISLGRFLSEILLFPPSVTPRYNPRTNPSFASNGFILLQIACLRHQSPGKTQLLLSPSACLLIGIFLNYSTSAPMSPSTVDVITTIAGTGTGSYSGDNGAATSAALYCPYGVALDTSGPKP